MFVVSRLEGDGVRAPGAGPPLRSGSLRAAGLPPGVWSRVVASSAAGDADCIRPAAPFETRFLVDVFFVAFLRTGVTVLSARRFAGFFGTDFVSVRGESARAFASRLFSASLAAFLSAFLAALAAFFSALRSRFAAFFAALSALRSAFLAFFFAFRSAFDFFAMEVLAREYGIKPSLDSNLRGSAGHFCSANPLVSMNKHFYSARYTGPGLSLNTSAPGPAPSSTAFAIIHSML